MYKSEIIGNLGGDAVTKKVGGDTVVEFSVAVTVRKGKAKESRWFRCSHWYGEKVAEYLTKGTKVYVRGEVSSRIHEGEIYDDMRVSELELLGGGKRDDKSSTSNRSQTQSSPPANYDDIPF